MCLHLRPHARQSPTQLQPPKHPQTQNPKPKNPVYRFLCLFSLAGVVFLSSLARMLLSESPFFPARSKHGLSRREMGWAVVEVRVEGGMKGRCMYVFDSWADHVVSYTHPFTNPPKITN